MWKACYRYNDAWDTYSNINFKCFIANSKKISEDSYSEISEEDIVVIAERVSTVFQNKIGKIKFEVMYDAPIEALYKTDIGHIINPTDVCPGYDHSDIYTTNEVTIENCADTWYNYFYYG